MKMIINMPTIIKIIALDRNKIVFVSDFLTFMEI